jgi:hypothetical protein
MRLLFSEALLIGDKEKTNAGLELASLLPRQSNSSLGGKAGQNYQSQGCFWVTPGYATVTLRRNSVCQGEYGLCPILGTASEIVPLPLARHS